MHCTFEVLTHATNVAVEVGSVCFLFLAIGTKSLKPNPNPLTETSQKTIKFFEIVLK